MKDKQARSDISKLNEQTGRLYSDISKLYNTIDDLILDYIDTEFAEIYRELYEQNYTSRGIKSQITRTRKKISSNGKHKQIIDKQTKMQAEEMEINDV